MHDSSLSDNVRQLRADLDRDLRDAESKRPQSDPGFAGSNPSPPPSDRTTDSDGDTPMVSITRAAQDRRDGFRRGMNYGGVLGVSAVLVSLLVISALTTSDPPVSSVTMAKPYHGHGARIDPLQSWSLVRIPVVDVDEFDPDHSPAASGQMPQVTIHLDYLASRLPPGYRISLPDKDHDVPVTIPDRTLTSSALRDAIKKAGLCLAISVPDKAITIDDTVGGRCATRQWGRAPSDIGGIPERAGDWLARVIRRIAASR